MELYASIASRSVLFLVLICQVVSFLPRHDTPINDITESVPRLDKENHPLGIHTKELSRSAFVASIASTLASSTANAATAESKKDKKPPSILQESLSGSIAGIALTLTKTGIKYPLDTATVRLQKEGSTYSIRDPAALFDGCYRGVQVPLLSNIPSAAVFFAVKDSVKEYLSRTYTNSLPRWISTTIAVGSALLPYWVVRNPSEVVKTKQQAEMPGYGKETNAWEALRKVGKEGNEGSSLGDFISRYYVGYWENVLYALPADVLKFIFYEQLSGGKKNLPPLEGAVTGAASTAVAQLLTTPLDVVRNRCMMTSDTEEDKSYIETLVGIFKTEGLPGLFAGASPRVGKAILSGAIQFATYEQTKIQLRSINKQ